MRTMHKKQSFSLMEVMVVVIVLAILAGIGIPSYIKTIERTYNKQALSMIKMTLEAEKIYRLEKGKFVSCTTKGGQVSVSNCNTVLRIDLPEDRWEFTVTVNEDGDSGTIRADRKANNGRFFMLDFDKSTSVDASPICRGQYCP